MALIIGNKVFGFEADLLADIDNASSTVKDINDVLVQWYNEESTFMELHTSGSTSIPKPIRLSKEAMRQSALKTQNYFNYKKGDKALLALPVKFVGGMMMLLRAIVSELDLIIVEPSLRPLKDLNQTIQFVPLTPAQLIETLKLDRHKLKLVDTILLGGGPVTSALQSEIETLSNGCYHSFGMTETISHIAIKTLNGKHQSDDYKALEGVSFETSKDSTLIINTNHLDSTVVTNDVVELTSDRSFIWKGRLDNVVNSGGVKLFPESIETKLVKLIPYPFFLIGQEDAQFGHILALVIESKEEDLNALNLKIKPFLKGLEQPKRIYNLENFIRTDTGKIKRKETFKLALSTTKEDRTC